MRVRSGEGWTLMEGLLELGVGLGLELLGLDGSGEGGWGGET